MYKLACWFLLVRCMLSMLASAQEQQGALFIEPTHAVMRPGLIHRFRVQLRSGATVADGTRAQLVCAVMNGERALLQRDFGVVSGRDLRAGISVNWVVPAEYAPGSMRITAAWLQGSVPLRAERQVLDVISLGQDLSALAQRVDAFETFSPLPHLWLEQAALELQAPGDLLAADIVAHKRADVANWLNRQRAKAAGELAFRCVIDRSVQPYRWFPTALSDARGVVMLLGDTSPDQADRPWTKSRWPQPSGPLFAALSAAGLHVLQLYPAGDRSWQGVGLRRVEMVLADLRRRQLLSTELPMIGLGQGQGAAGLLRMALARPHRLSALILQDSDLPPTPTVAKPADGDQALWFAQRLQLSLRGAHLAGTQLVLVGKQAEGLQWLRAYEPQRAAPVDVEASTWWSQLLETTGKKPAILPEYIALESGPVGPFMLAEIHDSQLPARIRFDATAGLFTLINAGGLAWIPGREVSGVALPAADDTTAFQAPLRLDAYLGGPVVLVVGTGEHAASQAANARWVQSFTSRWVAHAQGVPPVILDRDFDPEAYQDYHWVLIGGPRSNAQAARLQARETEKWPVQSDGRQLSFAGQQFLRSELTAVVYAVRDSSRPGLATIVADGEPILDGAAFPWQGMGSLLWQQSGDHPRYMR